jgi:hypothetical protein
MHRKLILIALGVIAASSMLDAQTRAYTNDNGSVIQAELVSHRGDKVKLKRADGKEFEVSPSIFSDEDEAFIRNWMARTPTTQNFNLRVGAAKKKIEGNTTNLGYKRVKNDLWSYVISITNNSQESVSKLTVKYRFFHSNAADGEYSASTYDAKLRMIEGKAKMDAELAFNRTLEVTTTPVQLDLVNYSSGGSRYKDSLRGCVVRIEDEAGNIVLDWVSPDVTMKGKTWANTTPAKAGGAPTGDSVIIR